MKRRSGKRVGVGRRMRATEARCGVRRRGGGGKWGGSNVCRGVDMIEKRCGQKHKLEVWWTPPVIKKEIWVTIKLIGWFRDML